MSWIMHLNILNLVEKFIFRQRDRNYLLSLAFLILEKELRRRDRQRFLQDFIVNRKFMTNQGL